MKTNKLGFSLIELLVALSILAVVAAIIVPRFLNVRTQAATSVAQAQQQTIQNAVQQFISVGGTIATGTASSDIINFLMTMPGSKDVINTTTRTSTGGASIGGMTDNSGTINSTTISLPVTVVNSTVPASPTPGTFYVQTGKDAFYVDGAGQLWDITIGGASWATASIGGVRFTASGTNSYTDSSGHNYIGTAN
jgi:prepilin-type N-terminal cleavage/methylation domain-containing protein